MLKLLLFITIIISLNCAANTMFNRSTTDIEQERAEFYKQAQPISRIRHAGNLPLLSAQEIINILYGLNLAIQRFSKTAPNSKASRELRDLREQLEFRKKYGLYKPENSDETNDVQMIRRTEVFD